MIAKTNVQTKLLPPNGLTWKAEFIYTPLVRQTTIKFFPFFPFFFFFLFFFFFYGAINETLV